MKRFTLCLLSNFILVGLCPLCRAGAPIAEHYLVLAAPQEDPDFGMAPILERELFRQALLITARDDMGLKTRDAVLEESMPKTQGDIDARSISLNITVSAKGNRLQLQFTPAMGKTHALEVEVNSLKIESNTDLFLSDIADLAVKAESLSRSDFSAWLSDAKMGLATSRPAAPVQSIPSAVENFLSDLTVFGQFAAVRTAHQDIADHGPSTAMLETLIRGYANLAQLTRVQWSGASDVFAARSLLYSQRLVLLEPNLPRSHWTRAYALAMAGLHAAALADLQAAPLNDNAPVWVRMIDLLCHYDTAGLLDLASSAAQQANLCRFMAYLTVENSGFLWSTNRVANILLEQLPDCDRIIEPLLEESFNINPGFDLFHITALPSDPTFTQYRRELDRIDPMPGAVANIWDTDRQLKVRATIAGINQAFVDTDEDSEPSWSVLGRMLQELFFVQIFDRANYVLKNEQSVLPLAAADFCDRYLPLVKGAPKVALIEAIRALAAQQPAPNDSLKSVPLADFNFRWSSQMDAWTLLKDARSDKATFRKAQIKRINPTAWDWSFLLGPGAPFIKPSKVDENTIIGFSNGRGSVQRARYIAITGLMAVSPFCPIAPAVEVTDHELVGPNDVKLLDDKFNKNPVFALGHAKWLCDGGQFADAIELLKSNITTGDDVELIDELAECYRLSNDDAQWISTIKRVITLPTNSDDHAHFIAEMAFHLEGQMKYQQSLDYIIPLQRSDHKQFLAAARCYSGLSQWNMADTEYRAYSFGTASVQWYCWCLASGHGDKVAAEKSAKDFVGANPDSELTALFYLLQDDRAKAIEIFQRQLEQRHDSLTTLWLADLYDRDGDVDNRDKCLADVINYRGIEPYPGLIADLLRDLISQNFAISTGYTPSLLRQITSKAVTLQESAITNYFLGDFLNRHGQKELAQPYLFKSDDWSSDGSLTSLLARIDLRNAGVDPFHSQTPTTQPSH